jgi:uncharacterized membrane protein
MDITSGTDMVIPKQDHAHAHSESFKHWIEGIHIQFPTFKHDHPPIVDVNKVADEQLTVGDRIADAVSATIGSWRFIIIQSILLTAWIALNVTAIIYHWDPYPFILLNLMLSFQAAYAAPFVMMSQNRQAAKDRLMAESDYHCNVKGEVEVRNIMEHLDHQDTVIFQILQHMDAHHKEVLEHLARLDPEMARRLGTDIQQLAAEETADDSGGNS